MIRKRSVFHSLASLSTDTTALQSNRTGRRTRTGEGGRAGDEGGAGEGEGEGPEPGTLQASLAGLPRLANLTDSISAHPSPAQLARLTSALQAAGLDGPGEEESVGEGEGREGAGAATQPASPSRPWQPSQEWAQGWKAELPLQTIMRMLQVNLLTCSLLQCVLVQVLVPQVERMCLDRGLTDESEILSFLQQGNKNIMQDLKL